MKALIIDDEVFPAKHLAKLIENHCPQIENTEICLLPKKALQILNDKEFDLIFLDIQMPRMNGLELLEQIILPKHTRVIVTSAYMQYAMDAFNLDLSYFLLKPIKKSKLIDGLRKVLSEKHVVKPAINGSSNLMTIFYQNEYHILKEEEIMRLEAARSYTQIVLANKKFITSNGLGYYEKRLSADFFYRCHNSHIVNLKSISKLGKSKGIGKGGYLVLSNEDIIPIGISKREKLEKLIGI